MEILIPKKIIENTPEVIKEMSKKRPNLKMSKYNYIAYRQRLAKQNIFSYYDQSGRLFTPCNECIKKDCKARTGDRGCMIGEIGAELEEKIKI